MPMIPNLLGESEEEQHRVKATCNDGWNNSRIHKPRVASSKAEVAKEPVAIALQQLDVPPQVGSHLLVPVEIRSRARAIEHGRVERWLPGDETKKRILILNYMGCDDGQPVLLQRATSTTDRTREPSAAAGSEAHNDERCSWKIALCPVIAACPLADEPGRHSGSDAIFGYVAGHYGSRADDSTIADYHAWKDNSPSSDPYVVAD